MIIYPLIYKNIEVVPFYFMVLLIKTLLVDEHIEVNFQHLNKILIKLDYIHTFLGHLAIFWTSMLCKYKVSYMGENETCSDNVTLDIIRYTVLTRLWVLEYEYYQYYESDCQYMTVE